MDTFNFFILYIMLAVVPAVVAALEDFYIH